MKHVVDGQDWETAYWEWEAKYGYKRVWSLPGNWKIFLGSDETNRRTLVVGPIVIALWHCRCSDCKEDRARLTLANSVLL
jgi:hypothetical protein